MKPFVIPNESEPEDPEIARVQSEAIKLCQNLCSYAQVSGYAVAVISLTRMCLDTRKDLVIAPGATILHADRRAAPALRNEARALRVMADELDKLADECGAESVASYCHEVPFDATDRRGLS